VKADRWDAATMRTCCLAYKMVGLSPCQVFFLFPQSATRRRWAGQVPFLFSQSATRRRRPSRTNLRRLPALRQFGDGESRSCPLVFCGFLPIFSRKNRRIFELWCYDYDGSALGLRSRLVVALAPDRGDCSQICELQGLKCLKSAVRVWGAVVLGCCFGSDLSRFREFSGCMGFEFC